ncbi:hypothetical protein pb186bvf_007528 [Paramecium bursaria]
MQYCMCIPVEHETVPKLKSHRHQMLKAKRELLEQQQLGNFKFQLEQQRKQNIQFDPKDLASIESNEQGSKIDST